MPAEPEELVLALLTLCREQHLCLDREDVEGVLVLAERRDELQGKLTAFDGIPQALHEPLRDLAKEGDRLLARMEQLMQAWQQQETKGVQQVRGMQVYVEEGQSPSEARFLDRHK